MRKEMNINDTVWYVDETGNIHSGKLVKHSELFDDYCVVQVNMPVEPYKLYSSEEELLLSLEDNIKRIRMKNVEKDIAFYKRYAQDIIERLDDEIQNNK